MQTYQLWFFHVLRDGFSTACRFLVFVYLWIWKAVRIVLWYRMWNCPLTSLAQSVKGWIFVCGQLSRKMPEPTVRTTGLSINQLVYCPCYFAFDTVDCIFAPFTKSHELVAFYILYLLVFDLVWLCWLDIKDLWFCGFRLIDMVIIYCMLFCYWIDFDFKHRN